jgi:hypothetical protein
MPGIAPEFHMDSALAGSDDTPAAFALKRPARARSIGTSRYLIKQGPRHDSVHA